MLFNKKEDYPSCQICRISAGGAAGGAHGVLDVPGSVPAVPSSQRTPSPVCPLPSAGHSQSTGTILFAQVAFQALVFQVEKKNHIPPEPLLKSRQVTKV